MGLLDVIGADHPLVVSVLFRVVGHFQVGGIEGISDLLTDGKLDGPGSGAGVGGGHSDKPTEHEWVAIRKTPGVISHTTAVEMSVISWQSFSTSK